MPLFCHKKANVQSRNCCFPKIPLSSRQICCCASIQHESWVTHKHTQAPTLLVCAFNAVCRLCCMSWPSCYVISVGLTQPSRVQDKHTAGVPHHLFPSSPRFSSLFSRSTLLVHVFPRVFLYMTTGLPSHDDRIHQWGFFPLCEMTVWMKISGIIKPKPHMSFFAPPLVFRTT